MPGGPGTWTPRRCCPARGRNAADVLGVIGIWYPQLFGNGLDMARDAFLGISSAGLLLTLFALKPLVTALCLGSGASGGLFTPTLATGAVLGGAAGIAWNLAWPAPRPARSPWSARRP